MSSLQSAFRCLKNTQEVEPYLADVSRCADENRSSFGFLPLVSYAEAAARGRLWVIVDRTGSLAAYLFFGGRFPNISVTQLFVMPASRRAHLGRRLVEELKAHAVATGIQTISARVAADLEANLFWERCGFILLRQIAGGQVKDRVINVRVFEVPDCSLWPAASASSVTPLSELRAASVVPNYVIDLNVFFDAIRRRVDTESARKLIGAAMANRLRICVTSEFANELKRTSRDQLNDPVLNLALSLPVLPRVPSNLMTELIAGLGALIFPDAMRSSKRQLNDGSDLLHLATCIHHRTSGFITREKAILRNADALQRLYGLEVMSIDDIVQGENETSVAPLQLAADVGGETVIVTLMMENHRPAVQRFLDQTLHLSANLQVQVLDPGTSHAPKFRLIGFADDRVIGFCSYSRTDTATRQLAAFLAVDELSLIAQPFIDHVLQRFTQEQPLNEPCLVLLQTVDSQQLVVSTALSRAYVPLAKSSSASETVSLHRVGFRGIVFPLEWAKFRGKLLAQFDVALPAKLPTFSEARNTGIARLAYGSPEPIPRRLVSFETFLSPLLLLLPGRPGAIVPIREQFAEELLQLPRAQLPLLPGREVQLRIERAYFGRPGFEKAFVKDGIVVFYVSGAAKGRMAAVGAARVTFSGRVPLDKAHREFLRYGVLENQMLKTMTSADGLVGMFSFDSFFPFVREVPYAELSAMGSIGGANLVTAQKLTDAQLLDVLKAGCLTN